MVKLVYMLPGLHHSGGTLCEPVDLPVTKRHLEMVKAKTFIHLCRHETLVLLHAFNPRFWTFDIEQMTRVGDNG